MTFELIQSIINNDEAKVESVVADLLGSKLHEAINSRRIELAKQIFEKKSQTSGEVDTSSIIDTDADENRDDVAAMKKKKKGSDCSDDDYDDEDVVKESTSLDEAMKPLPRRHFFNSFGVEGHGIAHDGKENHWKFENNKPVAHTKDPEVVAGWKRDLAAKSRANEEVELEEEQKIKVSDIKAALKNVKNASSHTKKMIKANPTQNMPHDSSRHAAYSEEFELDEAFKPGDKVTYETSKYSKDNKGVVHSVDGEHITIKGHDMLGKPHHIEVHQGFVKKIREEAEEIEEISRNLVTNYIRVAKPNSEFADTGVPAKGKDRTKGVRLAFKKKFGDKKFGFPEPKVKATD